MRNPQFEIVRIVLSALGFLLLLAIGLRLLFQDSSNQAASIIGWGILLLLAVGVVGVIRKRKRP